MPAPGASNTAAPTRLVLLPGMGADRRLLEPQRPLPLPIECPPWLPPGKAETLEAYAARMAQRLDASAPLLLGGISFGGMLALEVARHVRPMGVLLISSCRSPQAIPWAYRCVGRSARWLPPMIAQALKSLPTLVRGMRRELTAEQTSMVLDMLQDTPASFLLWSVSAILGWKGRPHPGVPVCHIHGDRDVVIPLRRVQPRPDVVIAGAGHLMNITHADQVNHAIERWLEGLITGKGVGAAPCGRPGR